MSEYLSKTVFSSFFLLACGAVVNEGGALAGLEATAKKYVFSICRYLSNKFGRLQLTDTFAFGAERLISHHVAIWMISYASQVIVGTQPSKDCIGNLLYSSSIGKHTSVVYLNNTFEEKKQVFTSTRYIWEHESLRPNSFSFPLACPSCRHIYSWRNIPSHFKDGASAKLVCKTKVEGGKCKGSWEVPQLPSSFAISSPYVGTWRKL